MRYVIYFSLFLASIGLSAAIGEQRGYLKAEAKILKVNPPSDALEMACLGLWVGEQNKKYAEKNK